MDLISYSDSLQKEAENIVKETDIVGFLNSLGKVMFGGRIVHNTLFRRDIDIYIQAEKIPEIKDIAFLTEKLVSSRKFKIVAHVNCIDFEDDRGMRGYY